MLIQETLIKSETNTQLCDCGKHHDYAVIDRNIVWYCATYDGYFVFEQEDTVL